MTIVLFDVDMTLVDPAGAGRAAMTLAFEEMFGVPDGLADVPFAGRTDRFILREGLSRCGRLDDGFDALVPIFAAAYAERLGPELARRSARPMPGARDVLELLAAENDVRVGAATGNFQAGALLKLEHCELLEHLKDGAFGDDHIDRALLVADAIRRVRATDGRRRRPAHRVFVVGDTEHDVKAARSNGCTAVAVATGHQDPVDLLLAGADMVFFDLSEPEEFVGAILAPDEPLD